MHPCDALPQAGSAQHSCEVQTAFPSHGQAFVQHLMETLMKLVFHMLLLCFHSHRLTNRMMELARVDRTSSTRRERLNLHNALDLLGDNTGAAQTPGARAFLATGSHRTLQEPPAWGTHPACLLAN